MLICAALGILRWSLRKWNVASVFFNLQVVSKSPTEISTLICNVLELRSRANLPCLLNLALGVIHYVHPLKNDTGCLCQAAEQPASVPPAVSQTHAGKTADVLPACGSSSDCFSAAGHIGSSLSRNPVAQNFSRSQIQFHPTNLFSSCVKFTLQHLQPRLQLLCAVRHLWVVACQSSLLRPQWAHLLLEFLIFLLK